MMHSDNLYGRHRPCRSRAIFPVLLAVAVVAGMGIVYSIHRKVEDLKKTAVTRADLKSEGLGHFARLQDEVRHEIDGARKESHNRRKALADEIRREIGTAHRKDAEHLSGEFAAAVASLAGTDSRLAIKLDTLEGRLKKANGRIAVLDKLWLEHRCPEPCRCGHAPMPPVPSKTLPLPVPRPARRPVDPPVFGAARP